MKTYQLCVLIGLVLRVHSDRLTPSPNKDDEEFAKNYMKKLNMEEENKSSFGRKINEMSLKLGSHPKKPLGPEPNPIDTPNACDPNLVMDAVTTLRGEKIFFMNSFFWRVHPQFTLEQHPIKYFWPELPDNIDAAFEDESADRVYIIKGQKVWALRAFDIVERLDLGSFKLPDAVKRIDAALYDENSKRVLFIVGTSYYSYDIDKKVMDKEAPKPVEHIFPGMSETVTAAFQENGNTYLFSGSRIFHFSNGKLVDMLKSNHFFKC